MMTTYLNQEELTAFRHVGDKELEELFREVHKMFPNRYLLQERVVTKTVRKFLSWKREKTTYAVYTMYIILSGSEVQVFNWPSEDRGIRSLVPPSYIHIYFLGLLNGKGTWHGIGDNCPTA